MIGVGDVIHTSWGHSMTLHDFYRVEKVTPKTVVLQLLKKRVVGGGGMWPVVQPTDQVDDCHSFGEPQRCKIRDPEGRPRVWIRNCQLAYLEPCDPTAEYREDHAD